VFKWEVVWWQNLKIIKCYTAKQVMQSELWSWLTSQLRSSWRSVLSGLCANQFQLAVVPGSRFFFNLCRAPWPILGHRPFPSFRGRPNQRPQLWIPSQNVLFPSCRVSISVETIWDWYHAGLTFFN
jgi:hypothetical protein